MRKACVAALVLLTGTPVAAPAAESLGNLLNQIAPAKVPEGSVEVMGWVERDGDRSELVVTLIPKGQVKLVADPGVTVTPVARAGVTWNGDTPVSTVIPEGGYFKEPPTVRVPFAGGDGRPIEADVEYAYCLIDYQCLFGTAKVAAPTDTPRS